jgi:hypothetical protein
MNPLVAFYDIHGRKSEVLLFCPGHHPRHFNINSNNLLKSFVSFYVRSTARHAIHLQFDISANAPEIRAD